MTRRKEPGVAHKITFSKAVDRRLMKILAQSRMGISGFVEDAVVQRLARWEAADTFIDRKRRKLGFTEQSVFDLKKCHPSGIPKERVDEGVVENFINLIREAPELAWRDISEWWMLNADLGVYTADHWEATMAWYREQT